MGQDTWNRAATSLIGQPWSCLVVRRPRHPELTQGCEQSCHGQRDEASRDEQGVGVDVAAEDSGEGDGQGHEGDGDEEVEAGDPAEHLQGDVFLEDGAPDDHPDPDQRPVERQARADGPRVARQGRDGQRQAAKRPSTDPRGQEALRSAPRPRQQRSHQSTRTQCREDSPVESWAVLVRGAHEGREENFEWTGHDQSHDGGEQDAGADPACAGYVTETRNQVADG